MAEHQDLWPLTVLCAVLEVSRSGFYTSLHRQKTRVIDVTERALVSRVKAIADDTRDSYGSRRMAKQLQAEGFAVGRAKARRLMHQAGVAVRRPKRRGSARPRDGGGAGRRCGRRGRRGGRRT